MILDRAGLNPHGNDPLRPVSLWIQDKGAKKIPSACPLLSLLNTAFLWLNIEPLTVIFRYIAASAPGES
jgi:hypothetical protein